MKKIIIAILLFGSTTLFAQRRAVQPHVSNIYGHEHENGREHEHEREHGYNRGRHRTVYVRSYSRLNYGYTQIGVPYYYYPNAVSTDLNDEIEGTRAYYRDRINEAKHNSLLSHSEKREAIRTLKTERDEAINDLEIDYYRR